MTIKKLNLDEDKARVEQLYKFENELRAEGYNLIAGVDEAGRGALIGAVVIGAVILPPNLYLENLDDSKKLSPQIREKLYNEIISNAVSVASVAVSVEEIDKLNIYQATLNGMIKAVNCLPVKPDFVLADAMNLHFKNKIQSRALIHGDALSASIAAASIVAKVTRDRLTEDWSKIFPQYGFEKNRGYGTKEHLAAIEKFGFTPLHRKTFEPYKSSLRQNVQLELF